MTSPALYSLLVVDDEPDLRTLYELTLLREGYEVETAGSVEDAWQHLQDRTFSAVITDMRLPDGTGLDLLKRIESEGRREKAIVMTAYGSAENAVEALKAGAYDYLTKPVDLRQFRSVVSSALGRSAGAPTVQPDQLRAAEAGGAKAAPSAAGPGNVRPPAQPAPPPAPQAAAAPKAAKRQEAGALVRMVGSSQALQHVRGLIDKVAKSMAPVLIWGESGTGKELVARAIHETSSRGAGPFVAVNCGAIPEQLLEAEFFGYRKGAFTGASEDREGFFQAADGGSLFLDEIGDLPLSMQSKLLRVIQERAVRPIGAIAEIPVDVRVISATHKDLAAEVAAGRFRQDLFYRLNVIQIPLPPLRQRLEDLPGLCTKILERIAAESGLPAVPQLGRTALVALLHHSFPGNVRELENLLHRAVTLSGHQLIEAADLGLSAAGAPALAEAHDIVTGGVAAHPFLQSAQPAALSASPPAIPPPAPPPTNLPPAVPAPESPVSAEPAAQPSSKSIPSDLTAHLDEVEREIIVQALERHRLNRTAAGASLGLSLRQMRYRMARLGIKVTDQGVVLGERFDPDADSE